MEIKKILAPTDFSDYAREGVDCAIGLASQFKADLILLHVVSEELFAVMGEGATVYPVDEMLQDRRDEMREFAAQSVRPKLAAGATVKEIVTLGSPFVKIIETAKSEGVDLIVMSTHGRTGVSHLLIGSVTERVVRKASCPVLSVRPSGHEFSLP